jgi:hypothetical protein
MSGTVFLSDARTVVIYPANIGTFTTPPHGDALKHLPEAFEHLWHVNDPQYRNYALRCRSRDSVVQEAVAEHGVDELFKKAASTETQADLHRITAPIDRLPPMLRQACRTVANTTLGTQREAYGLDLFAERYECVVERPANRFQAISAAAPSYIVLVRGRVDGLTTIDGKKVVLEVKTRTRRLTRRIGPERAQLEMYLRLLNCERGLLIETYGATMQVNEYRRNDEYYNALMGRLAQFVERFVVFLNSPAEKKRYADMCEQARQQYVARMITGSRRD